MKRKSLKQRIIEICEYDWQKEQAFNLLPSLKKAIAGKGKIYAQVNNVSRSGMSRTITLFIIHKNEIINLNYTIFSKVYADKSDLREGIARINGCGMDMLFEATYRLYNFLFDQNRKPYQDNLNRYSQL